MVNQYLHIGRLISSYFLSMLLKKEPCIKLTLFVMDSSISSKLFFPGDQKGKSLIRPVSLQRGNLKRYL